MSDETGFVSVSEAAAALGISERQARRYAGRLDADDRREAGHGAGRASGLTVSLAAMRAARENATNDAASTCGPDVRPDAETVGAGRGPDAVLIDELRDQVKYLRSALEARDRDAAEMRATMRALVQAVPKALTSGSAQVLAEAENQNQTAPQVLAEASQNDLQGTDGPLDTMATKETAATKGGARIGTTARDGRGLRGWLLKVLRG
jgi:predicted ArsR family transcriptional regulator